jgi:hypothetical protein
VSGRVRVRLILADGGEFLTQETTIPRERLEEYDRLIDFLREDPQVLKELYIDHDRLCAAQLLGGED